MSTFFERYRKALAFKSLDVEPWIDLYFHRRIAAVVAAVFIRYPITPNQVTLAGIATGGMGSWMLFQAFFGAPTVDEALLLGAALFYFIAIILDSVDGQLARATGCASRVGRILDGVADVLVLLPAYVIVGFGVLELYGTMWFAITAVAGFSTWIHCLVYDKVKNLYVAHTEPEAGGAQGLECIDEVREEFDKACRHGSWLERSLLWLYLGYLQVQDRFASGSTQNRAGRRTARQIEEFRNEHRSTMFLATFLGLGTHMFIIYAGIALMIVDPKSLLAVQVLLATVFNLLMAVVVWRARKFHR